MNMRAQKPLPQAQPQFDLTTAETMKCEQCGSTLFKTAFVIKRVSAIVSPTGQEAIVPVQVYSCDGCSKVPSIFLKDIGMEEEQTDDPLFRPDLG
tara:strand:- start:301 stop:585 length:285 start_codon:yes stop_codon:yes gene_type:complete